MSSAIAASGEFAAAESLPAGAARPQVRRRRVFYIPGYDPIPARKYREMYRAEGAAQAALSGYDLTLKPGTGTGRYGWRVAATIDGAEVLSTVEVLAWTDIVQGSMQAGIAATYGQLLRTAWIYLASGTLWRLARLRKGPVIAALYPVAMLLAQALAALLVLWLVTALVARGLEAAGLASGWPAGLAGLVPGVVAATLLLRWFRRIDGRLYAHYLMHDYAFSARLRGANPPALEARLAEFAHDIVAALTSDADEVLVVGHSSGAHLAVSVVADLLRGDLLPRDGATLGLLTLGQVIPMMSFLPKARRLRADLRDLAAQDRVFWLDVSAPGDGASFALCDPVAVSGVAPPVAHGPLVISAAFTQTLRPETWGRLRWRFFRLHFQYLSAFDALPGTAGDYDYFRITAGPLTLRDRFAARSPSASRIIRPVSGHVAIA